MQNGSKTLSGCNRKQAVGPWGALGSPWGALGSSWDLWKSSNSIQAGVDECVLQICVYPAQIRVMHLDFVASPETNYAKIPVPVPGHPFYNNDGTNEIATLGSLGNPIWFRSHHRE